MNIQINGKQIDIGQALITHVRAQLDERIAKYYDRHVTGQVTFSREGHGYRADCHIHLGSGVDLQAHGEAADIYQSFEQASERLERRLRRYKRRLRDHHHGEREEAWPAKSYVIAQEHDDAEEPQVDSPVIIAEQPAEIPALTVAEAVMRLDLGQVPCLVFRNRAHSAINVVYRRVDGHIGWIDPANGAVLDGK